MLSVEAETVFYRTVIEKLGLKPRPSRLGWMSRTDKPAHMKILIPSALEPSVLEPWSLIFKLGEQGGSGNLMVVSTRETAKSLCPSKGGSCKNGVAS